MGDSIATAYIYLHFIPFSDLINWSEQYQGMTDISFKRSYPMVRIGDILTRNKTLVNIENGVLYKRAKIKVRNGGIELREDNGILGNKIDTKKQYMISKGQFLLSKIDARNGAFGVVPKELDGGVITSNFWTFDVDTKLVNPQYLALLTTTSSFVSYCKKASNGTTNRHYLQESLFLKTRIPLPDLKEQDVFVKEYLDKIDEANRLDYEIKKINNGIREWLINYLGISINEIRTSSKLQLINYRSLSKWSVEEIQRQEKFSFEYTKYNVVCLKDIITSIEGGKTPSTKRKDYWGKDVFWTSAKDMKELYLLNIKDKLSRKGVEETKLTVYPKGTVLGVFRSGILRHSFPVCITAHPVTINQDLKAFRINETKTKKLYFLFYLDIMQDLVLSIARKKGVTVESINADAFMGIPFVCPPMIVQSEIVRYIYEKKKLIYQKREEAKQLRLQAIADFESKIFD